LATQIYWSISVITVPINKLKLISMLCSYTQWTRWYMWSAVWHCMFWNFVSLLPMCFEFRILWHQRF